MGACLSSSLLNSLSSSSLTLSILSLQNGPLTPPQLNNLYNKMRELFPACLYPLSRTELAVAQSRVQGWMDAERGERRGGEGRGGAGGGQEEVGRGQVGAMVKNHLSVESMTSTTAFALA
jgi:hypothetical protein